MVAKTSDLLFLAHSLGLMVASFLQSPYIGSPPFSPPTEVPSPLPEPCILSCTPAVKSATAAQTLPLLVVQYSQSLMGFSSSSTASYPYHRCQRVWLGTSFLSLDGPGPLVHPRAQTPHQLVGALSHPSKPFAPGIPCSGEDGLYHSNGTYRSAMGHMFQTPVSRPSNTMVDCRMLSEHPTVLLVQERFGTPVLDRFASPSNHKVPWFLSHFPSKGAEQVHSLMANWLRSSLHLILPHL